MKTFVLLCVLITASLVPAYGQATGMQIVQSDAPSFDFFTRVFLTSGSTTYTCFARSAGASSVLTIASVSNASAGVFTVSAGHGFDLSTNPVITVVGGTSGWEAINGSFVATPINSTTFSIAVDTTSLGAVTGTLVVTTTAPRITQGVWAVKKYVADGSGNPLVLVWANGGYSNICNNKTTLSYQ